MISKATPPYRGVKLWIFPSIFVPMLTNIFLVNILVIWDDWCDSFGSLSVSDRKKSGVKKKSSKNFPFLCFFWKMTKFCLTLKLSKFVFFSIETHKQVHKIFLNTIQIIVGWKKHIRILFWYFYSTCGKKIIFWEKLKFFSQGIYCCFWKK